MKIKAIQNGGDHPYLVDEEGRRLNLGDLQIVARVWNDSQTPENEFTKLPWVRKWENRQR